MGVTNTLRPVSVIRAGGGVAVSSATLASATSDNVDSTYIQFPVNVTGFYWALRVEPHTLAAGYERHQIRGRGRIRTDAGTLTEQIVLGRELANLLTYQQFSVTSTMTEYASAWTQSSSLGLATAGTISDFNISGGFPVSVSGATEVRTAELYIDIDCRLRPQYTPEIRDAAGVNRAGGTMTDTNLPTLWFGAVGYDDLPPRGWSVLLFDSLGNLVFSSGNTGAPPTSVEVDAPLADGAYTVEFGVLSTIRGSDAFTHSQALAFTVANVVPPPSPPLVTVTEQDGGYLVAWENPGGQPWDSDYVVAEVWRDDCTGSARIATIPNGLNGEYLDLAIPQRDAITGLVSGECVTVHETCDITYRIRYWGYVSEIIEIPDTIPVQMVLGWPGTVGSIPSGWLRVTSMDGYYPRGASGTGAPSATGGSASHTHTAPAHAHTMPAHNHAFSGDTTGSSTSTTTDKFNKADFATVTQPHDHDLPLRTGNAAAVNTGSATPGMSTAQNVPPTLEVIWIRSDGSATEYPIGALGWSAENVSGWTAHSAGAGRFLRGAAAGGNGGAILGQGIHNHTIDSHTHTSPTHGHSGGTTGLSGPAAADEANGGGGTPRWLPRHTHPVSVTNGTFGTIPTNGGGTTGLGILEPPNRRLRMLRNTAGGTQTRIIGLYTGAVADLPATLKLCNGSNGTPDMRTWFARDINLDSVNSTGGNASHIHTTPGHNHGNVAHSHAVTIGLSTTGSKGRDTSGDLGPVPTTTHTHTAPNTAATTLTTGTAGGGTSSSASNLPVYKEAHFVRLDGITTGSPLAVPELKTSDFASVTVPSFIYGDGLDRITDGTTIIAMAPDRQHTYPRLVIDSVPIEGGKATISTTAPGEDMSLTIGVEGKPAIDALEVLLAAERVYWSPLGGTPGWYAPAGWKVDSAAPDVKVLSVSMARQPWPATDEPGEYL